MSKNKLTDMIQALVNGDKDKATSLFSAYAIEKSKSLLEARSTRHRMSEDVEDIDEKLQFAVGKHAMKVHVTGKQKVVWYSEPDSWTDPGWSEIIWYGEVQSMAFQSIEGDNGDLITQETVFVDGESLTNLMRDAASRKSTAEQLAIDFRNEVEEHNEPDYTQFAQPFLNEEFWAAFVDAFLKEISQLVKENVDNAGIESDNPLDDNY